MLVKTSLFQAFKLDFNAFILEAKTSKVISHPPTLNQAFELICFQLYIFKYEKYATSSYLSPIWQDWRMIWHWLDNVLCMSLQKWLSYPSDTKNRSSLNLGWLFVLPHPINGPLM